MNHECKKCLLLEAGEKVTYQEIMDYISTLDSNDLVDSETIESRLKHCKECDELISGMCRKCGCYIEVRARLKGSNCPSYDNRKW